VRAAEFAGGAEALVNFVADGDCRVAAAEGGECDPLVDKRAGDRLAQRQFAGAAEALDHPVKY
jgi:hypothetical protein